MSCVALYVTLVLGAGPFLLSLLYYHRRTAGKYSLSHKIGWYLLVAGAGVLLGYQLRDDPLRCTINLGLIFSFPLFAVLDTYVIYRKTGTDWGLSFFLAGCYAELYVVTAVSEITSAIL